MSGISEQHSLCFPEFIRHFRDTFAVGMLKKARDYKLKSNLLLSEVSELIKMCSQEESQSLLKYFREQMDRCLSDNSSNFTNLF